MFLLCILSDCVCQPFLSPRPSLSVCLSVCVFVWLVSVSLFVPSCRSESLCLSIFRSVYVSASVCLCMSFCNCLSVSLSMSLGCVSACLCSLLSVFLCMCLSFCQPACLSVCLFTLGLCLCFCLYVCNSATVLLSPSLSCLHLLLLPSNTSSNSSNGQSIKQLGLPADYFP